MLLLVVRPNPLRSPDPSFYVLHKITFLARQVLQKFKQEGKKMPLEDTETPAGPEDGCRELSIHFCVSCTGSPGSPSLEARFWC